MSQKIIDDIARHYFDEGTLAGIPAIDQALQVAYDTGISVGGQLAKHRGQDAGAEIDNAFMKELAGIDSRFLLAIVHRVSDLDSVARRLLAERGVDANGAWVGQRQATQALLG